jgi:hypothetical protein
MAAGIAPERGPASPRGPWPELDVENVAWFFGAVVAAAASILIVDRVPESHRDVWEFLAAVGFLLVYALAAVVLFDRGWGIPAGLAAAAATAMVPGAGYGLLRVVGAYPKERFFDPFTTFSWAVFGITAGTLVAALLAWLVTRLSFLFFVAILATHFGAQLVATTWKPSGDGRAVVALVVGGALVLLGLAFDAARRPREAFWLYLGGFGGIAYMLGWFALFSNDRQAAGWLPMVIAGAVVLVLSGILHRRVWATFGAAGLAGSFIHYVQAERRWFAYFLLGAAFAAFAAGLAVARRRGRYLRDSRALTETPPSNV